MQSRAAGLLAAIIAVDLLPDERQNGDPLWVIVSFAVGAVPLIALNAFVDCLETERDDVWPVG